MITETIQFEDLDGNPAEAKLHFHITKSRVVANMTIVDRMEALQTAVGKEKRNFTPAEMEQLLSIVKELMKLSYGERVEGDATRFIQTEETWERFEDSLAYDAFLWSLFENPQKANEWMINILPPSAREDARKELEKIDLNDPNEGLVKKSYHDYTRDQLLEMSQEEFDALVGTNPTLWDQSVLRLAYQRKSQQS